MRRTHDGTLARFNSRHCPRVTDGGDFILSAFSWEPLPAKLQDNKRVSLAS